MSNPASSPAEPLPWLLAAAEARPLVLDAAMGTRLMTRGLDLARDDPALWNLEGPGREAVEAVHRLDLEAGADLLLTNTFGASRANLARLGRGEPLEDVVRGAVAAARAAWSSVRPETRPRLIGAIGPTLASQTGGYREVVEMLGDGDDGSLVGLLLETHRFDSASRALVEIRGTSRLPILVTLDRWPDPPEDAANRLADLGAAALGVNCVSGMPAALEPLRRLPGAVRLPRIAKPSAGLPGEPPASPESFAEAVPDLLALGVRLIGGCCGTTESHVAALRAAVDRAAGLIRPRLAR